MDRYAEVFDVRGHKYDAAMRAFPTARDEEFRQLLLGIDVAPLKTVFDLPSGGGYLHRFVAPDAELAEFDPSTDFGSESALSVDLDDLQLPACSADLIVSLAALHHVSNKAGFLTAALQALRPDGWLCVGDVVSGSGVAQFLDEFVGSHNDMGHSGEYLKLKPENYQRLASQYAELIRCELASCNWHFDRFEDLAAFCRGLFGLLGVSDRQLLDALDRYVGIHSTNGGVALDWELLYLQFHVRP